MFYAARYAQQTRVADKLLRLARKLLAEDARSLDELCVGRTQLALVFLVRKAPGICISTAAEHLKIDKSAVTRSARRLEMIGYLERRRSRRDRRAWELHPNEGSERLAWIVRPGDTTPEGQMFTGFSDDDLKQLNEYLHRMVANLNVSPARAHYRSVMGMDPPPSFDD